RHTMQPNAATRLRWSFSALVLDLLISHRPGTTDKRKHRAQRHGVEWNYCVFASSLFSGDGAIGSVFSRSD
ncbi:hypothetical protein, partial [Klebsiella variicola]|uniref:hypothetical protein n=1 Tax=Klebsiella variicola TaxID=244366 RepID=UPI0038D04FC0